MERVRGYIYSPPTERLEAENAGLQFVILFSCDREVQESI